MDPFVGFEFVLLDGSRGPGAPAAVERREPRRERVDVIARQLRDFMRAGDPADDGPHGLALSPDLRLRRQVDGPAAWLAFCVDDGSGGADRFREVAFIVIAREPLGDAGRGVLQRLAPYAPAFDLPAPPVAVAVRLVAKVPSMVSEWYTKAAAGFIAGDA